MPRTRKPSTTVKKGSAHEGSKGDTCTKYKGGAEMDAENADSADASVAVAMEESGVAQQQRGEKRAREEGKGEETEGGEEKEGQPAAKKPRVAVESKESKELGPVAVSSGGSEKQATLSEQQPSYAVGSRSQESMTLKNLSMYSAPHQPKFK